MWATDTIPADLPPMVEFKAKADRIIKERWGIEVEHIRHNLIDRDVAEDYFGCSDWEILAKETLREVPLVDAVPVVRCRECKFYREFRTKRYNQLMRLCYRMGKHDMEFTVKPNDFCSYGQRKEADHEVSEP